MVLSPDAMTIIGALLTVICALLSFIALGEIKSRRALGAKMEAYQTEVMKALNDQREKSDQRYTELRMTNDAQFAQYGRQLAALNELVMKEIHQLDIRITRAEAKQTAIDAALGSLLQTSKGHD